VRFAGGQQRLGREAGNSKLNRCSSRGAMHAPLLRGKHEHGRRSLLFWCLLWSASLIVGLGAGRLLASRYSIQESELASPAVDKGNELQDGHSNPHGFIPWHTSRT
jgi:hypothetical protein